RGMEAPRPFVLRPPMDGQRVVAPGETFGFGITLIGDEALRLVPYLVLGLRRMGELGLGRAVSPGVTGNGERVTGETGQGQPASRPDVGGPARRGRFVVESLTALNPFTGTRQTVMRAGDALVTLSDDPV